MASWVQNMGLSKGSHLVEGSTLMPKWEDRSGIAIAENNINSVSYTHLTLPTTPYV